MLDWRWRAHAGVFLLCLSIGSLAAAAQELPQPLGKVNDFAQVLSRSERTTLQTQLDDLERATSAEVAFVSVTSLDGRTVEDYATALFNAWGIGKKDKDNGVLVLVSPGDRAMRIEVGHGLEGVMPDGLAGDIVRQTFLPRFREGDYRGGVLDGMARVIDIVRRNEVLTPEQLEELARARAEAGKSWVFAAFLAVFVGAGAFSFGSGIGARVIVQTIFGVLFTAGGFLVSREVAPRLALVLLVAFAIFMVVVGYRLSRTGKGRRLIRGSGGGTGWTLDASGSSDSSSSSGSSSSGDSFGGGSSGGGGASGHW